MAKRIVSLILVLCLCVGLLPTVHAWDEDIGLSKISIMTWQKSYRVLEVYTDGAELFMTPAQLSWLSGFDYTESNICTFTRGAKTVKVDTDLQLIYMAGATHGIYLPAACRQIGGSWYLPASGVLPWLNTHCAENGGVLMAYPNPVSVWDTTDSFCLTDYNFDLVGICSDIGISSLSLNTANFLMNNGIGGLAYLVPDTQGSSMGEEFDYYELFSDMIQDVSATDHAVNTWMQRYADFGNDLEAFSTGVGFLSPTLEETMDANYITYTKNAMEILIYCALFDQDSASKAEILQTLVSGSDSSSNSGMVSAANDVIREHSDIWEGIYNKVEHHVVDGLYDGLTSSTVLGLLGYAIPKLQPSRKQVARIGKYQNLMAEGLDGYYCYSGETTLNHLKDYVNFIQLYLYSSEQNHRAMVAYMKDSGLENSDTYTQCLERADLIEQELAYFIHISAYLEDDCSDRGFKDTAAKEYLELFEGIDPGIVPKGIAAAAEHAIYRAALEDMGLFNISHDVTDLDADGEKELLVVCDDMWEDWPSFIVIDPNNYMMGSYTDTFNSYSYLQKTSQGEYRILRKFDDGTGDFPLDAAVWSNTGFVFEDFDGSLQNATLPNPDLTEQNYNGNTQELLQQLDTYFGSRAGCGRYTYDLNGDGSNDRIYVMVNAADLWTRQCQVAGSFGGERHLDYDDDKITVLTAETQSTGVQLRICRLDFQGRPDEIILSETDRTITAGDYLYSYQATGAPFVCEEIPKSTLCAADLMGLTREQVQLVVDISTEEGTTAYGYCQGGYLTLTYTDGILTQLGVSSWSGDPVPLIDEVHTGDTLLQMMENAHSLTDWTNFERMGDYYYATSSSYRDSNGNNYIFTAAFDGTTPDSVLLYATISLC